MQSPRGVFLLTVLILFLSGCSMHSDVAVADRAVPQFHRLLDGGQFADIYANAAPELTGAIAEPGFVALLGAVHRKLGSSVSAEKVNWAVNYHSSGTFVTLVYKTVYAGGEASEQFVFRLHGEQAALAGYHISSNALILN
jgi:hypothetical protein